MNSTGQRFVVALIFALGLGVVLPRPVARGAEAGQRESAGMQESALVGYWRLRGDSRDHSGQGNHGVNHGVRLDSGTFDGRRAHVEVPASPSLQLGTGDFSISVWICTESALDDVVGDVLELYDPEQRRGFVLTVGSSGSGYAGPGNDRHVFFGIDNGRDPEWTDCGRPSPTSRYISNSMLVFRDHLYAAVTDAANEQAWAHVFRYEGGRRWRDCGRVGRGRTTGVGPLVVHNGDLYAVTWTYDWTRVRSGAYDPGRVYRYAGGTQWDDLGQPSDNRTLNGAISFQGKLYVGGGPETWGVFVHEGGQQWTPSQIFSKEGPRRLFPHSLARYNGRLYAGYPSVHAFDGREWTYAGLPGPLDTTPTLQTHSFVVHQGNLCAGTWPHALVSRYVGGEEWQPMGRVGADGTEVNSLVVYNGKLYGGSIPRAEVCRHDGDGRWTSLRRFYSPTNWAPAAPGQATSRQVTEWSRVTSLAVQGGRLFAGIGSCTSALVDTPPDPQDVLGRVFSMEAGKGVSLDHDLGSGWKHLAAVRAGRGLRLYVDGRLAAESSSLTPADFDLSVPRPLRIGSGQTDYFNGRMGEVRLYRAALSPAQVRKLASTPPR
jgi:hypothetical protein